MKEQTIRILIEFREGDNPVEQEEIQHTFQNIDVHPIFECYAQLIKSMNERFLSSTQMGDCFVDLEKSSSRHSDIDK